MPLYPDLITALENIVTEGVSKWNAAKLLLILLNDRKSWQLKIELSAYVEGLYDLRNLCYYLEADTTDMPFKVGRRLRALSQSHNDGMQLESLPSTHRLIMQAIAWGNDNNIVAPDPPQTPLTIQQIDAELNRNRPRRTAAIAAVQNAARAGESATQRRNRERQESAAAALAAADAASQREEERIAALEREAESQANNFLMTVDGWHAHLVSGIGPTLHYLFSRLFSHHGDRYVIAQFYEGAMVFDPRIAKIYHNKKLILSLIRWDVTLFLPTVRSTQNLLIN